MRAELTRILLQAAICLALFAVPAFGQTDVLLPMPRQQFFDANGKPLAGGLVFTYLAGTSTQEPTYPSSLGGSANPNPIVLDSSGSAFIYLLPGISYRFIVQSADSSYMWTADNVLLGVPLGAAGGPNQVQYNCSGALCADAGLTYQQSIQQLGAVNLAVTNVLTASNIDNTLYVGGLSKYSCDDTGLNSAITDTPAGGGMIDAGGCSGSVSIAAPVHINKANVTLKLGAGATYTNTLSLPSNQGMFSPEADNVTILGNNAKLVVVGSTRAGLRALNSCSNVLVRDLVVTGDATVGEQQEGIEFSDSSQGWTFKHIQIIHNTISNVNIGIDLVNTDTASTTEDVLVEGNKVFNIVGVLAGSGYGLISNNMNSGTNVLRPMALKIIGNHFENSGRHEVYTSMTSGVTVVGNTFLRHRSSVFTNADLAAVPIARVNNYVLANNVFDTCYDGCVDVETDGAASPGSKIARNISITGNTFNNSQWYDIIVGTGADPATDGFPDGVTISGNAFYKDSSQVPTQAFFLFIQAGKNISISSNSFYMKGLAGSMISIEGSQDAGGTATATDRIFIQGNSLFADTAGATPFRFNAGASTSAIRADFINNFVSIPSGNVFGFIASQTDPNIRVFNTLTSGLDMTKVVGLDGSTVLTQYADGKTSKHKRFGASCTTGASVGASCTTAYTWVTAFADANYTPVCVGVGPVNGPVLAIDSFSASTVTIRVYSFVALASSYSSVNCEARHD